jgi:hypothetical protein
MRQEWGVADHGRGYPAEAEAQDRPGYATGQRAAQSTESSFRSIANLRMPGVPVNGNFSRRSLWRADLSSVNTIQPRWRDRAKQEASPNQYVGKLAKVFLFSRGVETQWRQACYLALAGPQSGVGEMAQTG